MMLTKQLRNITKRSMSSSKETPEPAKRLFSHREDVSLANPLGPPARGWEQVSKTLEDAASHFRDGEATGFETVVKYVTPELAYHVEMERYQVKLGGMEDFAPSALRVTMIFRPEEGEWKVAHRHADAITTAQPAETVLQEE
jgi:ketosteroid isomerase-like protein